MADLRLLRRLLTGLCGLAVVLISGCAVGPGWARRVEGVVVVKDTCEPVAGAEVFQFYWIVASRGSHNVDFR